MEEVRQWLVSLGLDKYAPQFQEKHYTNLKFIKSLKKNEIERMISILNLPGDAAMKIEENLLNYSSKGSFSETHTSSYSTFPLPHARLKQSFDGEGRAKNCLDRYFSISVRGSTVKTEIFAGFVNFLANSYLLILVPQLLEQGGVPKSLCSLGIGITTFIASVMAGLTSNLPIVAGPGLGCAAYFAFGISTDLQGIPKAHKLDFSLTVCLVAGILMFVLSLCDIPSRLFRVVPACVKNAMPVGLGFLLSLCGMQQMGLIVPDPKTGLTMGSWNMMTVLGTIGVLLMVMMHMRHYKGAFILPMLTITIISWVSGLAPWPTAIFARPAINDFFIQFNSIITVKSITPTIALYLICLFDIAGIMYGVARVADLLENDRVPGAYWIFISCGFASMISPLVGCTPVIVYAESFAGVLVGGKTGLCSVVMGFLFLFAGFLFPVYECIPLCASSPVLVVLGVVLLDLMQYLELREMQQAFPSFLTIALMPYLYSIDRAIMAGLGSYILLRCFDAVMNSIAQLPLKKWVPTANKYVRGSLVEPLMTPTRTYASPYSKDFLHRVSSRLSIASDVSPYSP